MLPQACIFYEPGLRKTCVFVLFCIIWSARNHLSMADLHVEGSVLRTIESICARLSITTDINFNSFKFKSFDIGCLWGKLLYNCCWNQVVICCLGKQSQVWNGRVVCWVKTCHCRGRGFICSLEEPLNSRVPLSQTCNTRLLSRGQGLAG